ncbi:Lipopolysaccharide biosynthesis protein WzxC [Rubripirellula tenax]|uniref:Lipopolysaccharide biosynthesis protein WzxC n=1 Tax=Rubripirellula tenax TaxID=2528015 RepID=A0A5C6FB98_9BACT|nr:oligosaccharide flippase family protein [Rubripirellula tenax]TWU56871.1 Lipopolysaccharide biosynthesis protein WzxC [Rubripirellula tenax]
MPAVEFDADTVSEPIDRSMLEPVDSSPHSDASDALGEPSQIDRSDRFIPANSSSVMGASAWSMAGYGVGQGLRLVNNMALSYLLVPEAFGIMAIINLVIVGLGMFSDVGSGPCIIQNKRGDQFEFLNTAWLVGAIRGAVISLLSVPLAIPVANFFEQPSLVWLIPLASLTALIHGFASTSIFSLQRHLDAKSLAWLEISSQAIGSACMCLFAWISPTVYSLVWGMIALAVSRTVLSHRMIRGYRNRFQFNRTDANELFHFGKWVFVSTLMMFAAMQVDRMLMGKLFDIGTLGIYGFGLAIATLPRMMVDKLAFSVLYPVLSSAARDSVETLRHKLIVGRRVILSVGSAMIIGVFCTCNDFFQLLYHSDFHKAGEICQWLCLSEWIVVLTSTSTQALVAMGETRLAAKSNFAKLPTTIIASIIGFQTGGLEGFIVGLAVGSVVGHLVMTLSLVQKGMPVVKQDLLTTVFVFVAMAIVVMVQSNEWLNWPIRYAISGLIVVGFCCWALYQVNQYRCSEKAIALADDSSAT